MESGKQNEFPRRLRKLREQEGKSARVLSELCGLATTAVSRYESGEAKPTIEALVLLADYFHVSTDYLLGRTNY